ncbi:sh3 domain-binding glutamic acid-rich-like protein [Anaeramoeba flamelloides]|uniref:Sh3 domain-binding glutamic acid-rich-like protein n=1 Tax=Anaeramoeba flamelloides TaxID=1746091 RepID=A0AAV7YW67_9EUKA|nr:sh3 domain-binding glutamic acid-rich-like protein [Anaeramoeba flamelloides]
MTEELEQQWYIQNKVSVLSTKLQSLLEDCIDYLNRAFNDSQDQTIEETNEKDNKKNQKKNEKKTNLEQSQILYSSSDKEKEKDKENDKQKESVQEKQKENEREKNKDKEKKTTPKLQKNSKTKITKIQKQKQTQNKKKKKSKNKEMEKSNMQSMQTNVVMLNLTKGRITGYMTINEYKIIHADLQLAVIDHKSGKRKTVNTSIMGEIPFILRQAQDARQYLKLALIDLNVLSQQGKREIRTVEKMGVLLNVVKKILRRLNVARNALELNNYDVFPYSQTSDIYFQQLDLTNVVIDILIENDCLLVRAHSYKVLTQGFAEDKTVGNSMIGATVNYHNKLIEVTDEIESRFFLPNIKFFRNTLAKALELIRQLTENIEVLCSGF